MPKHQTLAAIVAVALSGSGFAANAENLSRAEFEDYVRAVEIGTIQSLNSFLREHPRSPAARQVFERINELTEPSNPAEQDLVTGETASIY